MRAARKYRSRSGCCSLRECLECDPDSARLCGLAENRLGAEKAGRVTPKVVRDGWSNFTFTFCGEEEIIRAALAKTGKDTGLRPEDL